ncbi:MAG: hypothetical protein KDB20_03345, partial [Microthrixaceae bacterium]|nr:hypothetical protein [Microthrixaceae bacterium]
PRRHPHLDLGRRHHRCLVDSPPASRNGGSPHRRRACGRQHRLDDRCRGRDRRDRRTPRQRRGIGVVLRRGYPPTWRRLDPLAHHRPRR